jgi:cell wall-associated NlpC family hydrolase
MTIKVMQMITQPRRINRSFALAITVLGLAACGSNPPRAASVALNQVGEPYRYGGNSPGGFDCSGLIQYSYSRAGYSVPRTTGQLWSVAETVDRHQLRAGDVLFFSIEGKMSHVGLYVLYVGEQRFVHAPQSGRAVSVESLQAPFYRRAFVRAGRLY